MTDNHNAGVDAIQAPEIDAVAWTSSNSGGHPHEVGQLAANARGLHDMQGNVWEWAWDAFAPPPPGAALDPLGGEGSRRVIRGGSWDAPPDMARLAFRHSHQWDRPDHRLGLRVAKTARP